MTIALFIGVIGLIQYFEVYDTNWCYFWIFIAFAGFSVAAWKYGTLCEKVRKLEGKKDGRKDRM